MFKAGILDYKGRGLKLHLDKVKAEESRTKLVKPERFEGKVVWDATLEVETWRPRGEDRRLSRYLRTYLTIIKLVLAFGKIFE